ncbi:MAG: hypothetical protein NC242_12870 [Roseburia sp.]|nr:hypothetical protein [Roseburia sp.]
MDSGAEYINVTFKGMEMIFDVTGKPIGAALRGLKVVIYGVCGTVKKKVDYVRDKDGVRSVAELRKLQYERSKPIYGEVEIRQIYDRYGADWDYLSLPLEHNPEALANFEKSVSEKGLCYSRAKDFDKTDNSVQIVIPREQRSVYLAYFEVLNKELMPAIDARIRDCMERINELSNVKNELNAKIKYLMSQQVQQIEEDMPEEESKKVVTEINTVREQVEGIEREISYVKKLKEKAECSKYSEINLSDYEATAGGKSKEAFERDGDLGTIECGKIEKYTRRGFTEESFDGSKEYLMNVGCANVYIERIKSVNSAGERQYSFALYDKGIKVDNAELEVTMDTGNKKIEAFEKLVADYVDTKNIELSKNRSYVPDKEDCMIFERIEEMQVLTAKMENFDKSVREAAQKRPSNINNIASEEGISIMQKENKSENHKREVDLRARGIKAVVPIDNLMVQDDDECIEIAVQSEYMSIPKEEFLYKKSENNKLEIELIVDNPDKKRMVYSKDGESGRTVTRELSFSEFGRDYIDKFKNAENVKNAVVKSNEEIGAAIDSIKEAVKK